MTVREHLHALDGLRLVGAVAVLTTHAGFDSGDALRGPFAGLLSRLDAGVALFFVVSGFLLFRPHVMGHLEQRSRPRTRPYLLRRAARILPVLWVAVTAAWLLVPTPGAGAGDYAAVGGLIHIYRDVPLLSGLTQFWSLATEVAFYLLLPAIAAVLCRGVSGIRWVRRTSLVLASMLVISPVWMAAATTLGHPQARLWLPGFVGWFAIGMILSIWHAGRSIGLIAPGRIDVLCRFPGTMWAIALSLYVLISTALGGPYDLSAPTAGQAAAKNVVYALLGLFVVLPTIGLTGPVDTPRSIRVMQGRVGSYLGQISYGVFAYHVIILALLTHLPGLEPFQGGFGTRWIIAFVGSVVVASLSYYGMERPIMRRVRGSRLTPGSGRRGRHVDTPAKLNAPATASQTSP